MGIIIWDPIERFLWGIAVTVLFIAGIQYLRMGKNKKDPKEKTLIFGFAFLFFSFILYRIFSMTYEVLTPGTYSNYAFYGDFEQMDPILMEIMLKCAYVSVLVGFMVFFFSIERYLKRKKYIITYSYGFFIIAIIILPINLAIVLEHFIISIISMLLLIFFLFYFAKYSRMEFRAVSSLLLLGLLYISGGLALTDNDFQKYNVIPIIIAPLLVIFGSIIVISPSIINPKLFYQYLIYWKIVGLLIFGGFCFSFFFIFYLEVPIFYGIEMFIILLVFSYFFYKQIKILKSEVFLDRFEEEKDELPNILGMFAKPQEIFRLIAENANDLIEIFDENFHIEYTNEEIHKNLLGYSKDDIIGQNTMEFIHPDDINDMIKKQKEFILNKEIIGEVRFKKKDGTYIWLEYRGKAYKTINYERKYLLISRDITQHKEFVKRLKEVDVLRKEFVIRATHDLKNPISSMYAISKLILNIFEEMPEHHKKILPENLFSLHKYLHDDSIRLKKLTHDLLDFSSLESRTFQLNKERINITEIINECITAELYLSKKRKIIISNNLPVNLYINADKIRIYQIFQNLISNALKNTPVNGKIYISSVKNKNNIKFIVKDTGIGLIPDEINKLFTKFCKIERKDNTTISEGFGCGLYISKQITLSHGGKIWAESQGRNKGSSFIIEIPIINGNLKNTTKHLNLDLKI